MPSEFTAARCFLAGAATPPNLQPPRRSGKVAAASAKPQGAPALVSADSPSGEAPRCPSHAAPAGGGSPAGAAAGSVEAEEGGGRGGEGLDLHLRAGVRRERWKKEGKEGERTERLGQRETEREGGGECESVRGAKARSARERDREKEREMECERTNEREREQGRASRARC